MSPSRPSTRRNSSGGFKPYTRAAAQAVSVTPIMVPTNSGSSSGSGSMSSSPLPSPTDPHGPAHQAPPLTPQLNQSPQHFNTPPAPPPSHIAERPGFPTYAQYKQVENAYLQSLTPRRQGKALISQRMFDRIWDVLHQPDSPGETAQFRFWARKMFTVKTVPGVPGGGPPGPDGGPPMPSEPQEVLLHDNLLVAIQEQLYDLLCYCHGSTGHGGRDKTCALIRKHYTWVPKDLVSSFIKTCPTCIMKKCGGGGMAMGMTLNGDPQQQQRQMEQQLQEIQARQDEQQRLQAHHQESGLPLPGMRDFFQSVYGMGLAAQGSPAAGHPPPPQGVPWPTMAASEHAANVSLNMSYSGSGSPSMSRSGSGASTGPASGSASTPGLDSGSGSSGSMSGSMHDSEERPHLPYPTHPMVREVTLYKGLPNGWQYRHADYASAHAEFMATKDSLTSVDENGVMQMHIEVPGLNGVQRRRVPSIVPMWGPDKFPQSEYEAITAENAEQARLTTSTATEHGHENPAAHSPIVDGQAPQFAGGVQQMSLQYLLMNPPKDNAPHSPQIDPVLLGISNDAGSASAGGSAGNSGTQAGNASNPTEGSSSSGLIVPANAPVLSASPSLKRAAAAPLHIDLDFPPPEKSFQALLAYRENLSDGNLTPDSPLSSWAPASSSGIGIGISASAGLTTHVRSSSGHSSFAYPASPTPSLRSDGSGGSAGGSPLAQLASFRVSLTDDAGLVGEGDTAVDLGMPALGGGGGGSGSGSGSSSGEESPASSALPTPVDELGPSAANAGAGVDVKGKRKMHGDVLRIVDESAKMKERFGNELSEGIQVALELQQTTESRG